MSRLDSLVPAFSNTAGGELAALIDPSRPCGGKMKGFALLHLVEYANQKYGADALRDWPHQLPPGATSVSWVPMELYFSAIEFLIGRHHGGNHRVALDFGHAMATRDIGVFFRAALRFAAPATVLSLSGRFWRSYFDFGSLIVTRKEPTEIELRHWPLRSLVAYHELAGSFIAWLEASKASEVKLSRFELTTPELVSMRIDWR